MQKKTRKSTSERQSTMYWRVFLPIHQPRTQALITTGSATVGKRSSRRSQIRWWWGPGFEATYTLASWLSSCSCCYGTMTGASWPPIKDRQSWWNHYATLHHSKHCKVVHESHVRLWSEIFIFFLGGGVQIQVRLTDHPEPAKPAQKWSDTCAGKAHYNVTRLTFQMQTSRVSNSSMVS